MIPLLNSLRDALQQSPENTPLRLSLSRMLLDAGLFEEAETELKQGLTLSPRNAHVETVLAEVYQAQGKFSVAIVLCEEVLERGAAARRRTW